MKLTTLVKQLKREYLAETKTVPTFPPLLCIMTCRAASTLAKRHYPKLHLFGQASPYYQLAKQIKKQIKLRIDYHSTVTFYLVSQNMDTSTASQHAFRLALIEDLLDWAAEQDALSKVKQ